MNLKHLMNSTLNVITFFLLLAFAVIAKPSAAFYADRDDAEVATIHCRDAEQSPSAKPTQQEKAKAD
jgi:hypothetical protein